MYGRLRGASDWLYVRLERIFFWILTHLPGSRFGADPGAARTYRSQVIWEEAARRGIKMEQLIFFTLKTDIYRAYIRGGWRYFISIPVPPELVSDASEWMDDKFLLKDALLEAGVASPQIVSVTTLTAARAAFERMKPVRWPTTAATPNSATDGRVRTWTTYRAVSATPGRA